jgi:hypothetical protein
VDFNPCFLALNLSVAVKKNHVLTAQVTAQVTALSVFFVFIGKKKTPTKA